VTTGGGLFGNTTSATTGGGLFGNTTPATTGGGLFGNTTPTTTGGGLFGNPSNTTTATTGGGLFGNTSTNNAVAPSGGLFGNKPTSGGLFGNTSAAPATSGGLFAKPPSTTPSFGGGSTPLSGGLFGNAPPQAQGDQSNTHTAEIQACLQNYLSQIDCASQKNNIVYCMYNKYGKNVSVILKEQIKNACPVKDIASVPANAKISGESTEIKQVEVFINQKKYAKAKRENPDTESYYIKQVNSFEELFE
jgi:hypothetical protein